MNTRNEATRERECIELCNWVVDKVVSYLDNNNILHKDVRIELITLKSKIKF